MWHSSLTQENSEDLERVQKAAVKLILGKNYENYEDALIQADLESLQARREELCKKIAKKCVSSDNMRVNSLFTEKIKVHTMATRDEEYYQVKHANTGFLMKSAVPYMQRL